jgi:hypothetical protein
MSAPTITELDALPDAQVLDRLRHIESSRRELEVEEAALIEQVQYRSLATAHGCKKITDFLRYLLTIGARDAAGRIKLSQAVMPRRMLTGELVEPVHPQTAAALAAGAISARAPAS